MRRANLRRPRDRSILGLNRSQMTAATAIPASAAVSAKATSSSPSPPRLRVEPGALLPKVSAMIVVRVSPNCTDCPSCPADATWVGAIPFAFACNNRSWNYQDCETANVLILRNTGPSPDEPWVDVPNTERSRGGRLLEPAPRRLQLPLLRWFGEVRQGNRQSECL